ncbi:MAG: M20 family metallopeptidase [Thermovirgaceae bacterium]|jgi:acetylornithine deacetylase/succinyl-diaminopimelate desuccinylase|nr:M20 family metallopeptidase [Synergistales bacterium]MDY0178317.1 M20 family metallopeptidase [Synergistaceae bacterium]HRW87129.1 M20 family metallopeptidase [Thermovirgaceae bacterium]MDD3830287.1 M20 family metallopeptidase [Synergistales bacterium]MDD4022580.1 M20 family metallopeptidase [Synergistales bacterium]
MNRSLTKIISTVSSGEIAELTARFIRIPSHWDVPTREEEMVEAVASFLSEEKIPFTLQHVGGTRNNIIATIKGEGGGKSLALSGHLDTVPPYNMEVEPFAAEISDGKIFGRGAVDMKGPVAAMLMTLAAYRRAEVPLKGDLVFAGVLAEETNSDGSETLIRSGFRTDGAIVGEPSDREYAIGHRGLEWIEVEFFGKTAHGGVPQDGINAIVHAARFIGQVQEKIVPKLALRGHPHMGPSVMNFGRIEGGTQPSTVADHCLVRMDRRYISSESLDEVIAEYQGILDELSREDPTFRAELKLMDIGTMAHFHHVPLETSPDDPIVKAVVDSIRDVSRIEPKMTTRRGWTDAAIFGHYGKIPTVVFGPGSLSRSHSKAEFITVDELEEGFRTYVSIAARFCGLA